MKKYYMTLALASLLVFTGIFTLFSEKPKNASTSIVNSEKVTNDLKTNFYHQMQALRNQFIKVQTESMKTIEIEIEPLFVDNENAKHWVDPADKLDLELLASQGIKLLTNKVLTHGEYLEAYPEASALNEFGLNRMIRIMEFFYPEYETKVGVYQNAHVTGIYDAETGLFIGSEVVGDLIKNLRIRP